MPPRNKRDQFPFRKIANQLSFPVQLSFGKDDNMRKALPSSRLLEFRPDWSLDKKEK